jgi:hypothetical protein
VSRKNKCARRVNRSRAQTAVPPPTKIMISRLVLESQPAHTGGVTITRDTTVTQPWSMPLSAGYSQRQECRTCISVRVVLTSCKRRDQCADPTPKRLWPSPLRLSKRDGHFMYDYSTFESRRFYQSSPLSLQGVRSSMPDSIPNDDSSFTDCLQEWNICSIAGRKLLRALALLLLDVLFVPARDNLQG